MEVVSQIGHRFKVETSEIKKVRLSMRASALSQCQDLHRLLPPSQSISSLIGAFARACELLSSFETLIRAFRLTDREYMRRSEDQQNVFEYVA